MEYIKGDSKETISFYKKSALSAKASDQDLEHVTHEYEIVSDETDGQTRTITLKEKDKSAIKNKAKEVVNMLLERLGETKSNTLRQLLMDTVRDYSDKSVEEMHDKLTKGEEPVKAKAACFKIIIGDGRRDDSLHLRIR